MKWMRSLAAELFLSWHQRRLLRHLQSDNEASLEALQNFRRKMTMTEEAENVRVRTPEAPGIRKDRRDMQRKDGGQAPTVPKTAGAPKPKPDTSKSPVANRDMEGQRKAGSTPRPTDKPITGA
jgi:hypothetical protein